ncbi:non-homologous end-joining DNA ligase [Amycolatopsis carbonis]|uniref:DNA ligase (ATP) n=1 Tax=Amycolatopsis carbonis TaxID=715471 RepID=A0A9Y2ICU1_9PSEU|nr:non-homologous end-joining DNA ligase [Amycolatopsis sp. 2-15]WIX76033.1 non-homologous end-joining DNA ligase [Amycolatopsis sp. 2-15]
MAKRIDVDVHGMPYPNPPMLAVEGELPTGPGWSMEWKWDGFRCCLRVGPNGITKLTSRNGNDLTRSFPDLDGIFADTLGGRVGVLDGEIVVLNETGRPDFGLLQLRHQLRPRRELLQRHPAAFYAFDLLMLGREMLLHEPYERRRELLVGLGPFATARTVITPAYRDVDPQRLLEVAREHHLEGLVAKRVTSHYLPGRRSRDWIKRPLINTLDVVVCGWRPGRGSRAHMVGSLVLGAREKGGRLRLVGDVGSGFTRHTLDDLERLLSRIGRPDSPFTEHVPAEYARETRWVEPLIVGEVAFRSWTREGRMRHVSWRGFRGVAQ